MRSICTMLQPHRRTYAVYMAVILTCISIFMPGCSRTTASTDTGPSDRDRIDTGFVIPKAGTYDSADTGAIVVSTNAEAGTVTLYNRTVDRNYTLNYDGTSKIYDKYGSSTVIDTIMPGDVVDVTFLKEKKLLNSMNLSADVWIYDEVTNFEIDSLASRIKINGGDYRFGDDLLIFSGENKIQLIDINSCDVLKICGMDHNILSIVIDRGHGYLRLKGQDYFVGGWIEVGSKIIRNVTGDMLLAVPVGKYTVRLTNGEYEGSREVSIEGNRETELDVSDLVVIDEEDIMYGTVILVTDPSQAEVYVDGKKADISKPLSMEYGIHQLIVRADGYESLTQYIKVGQENATLEVVLDKKKDFSSDNRNDIPVASPSPSPAQPEVTPLPQTVSGNQISDYRVYIEAPEDVEVYVDGSYVGVVPADFAKVEGSHVVTLRKDGYVTRSYTITLDALYRNETFSFASLEKIE